MQIISFRNLSSVGGAGRSGGDGDGGEHKPLKLFRTLGGLDVGGGGGDGGECKVLIKSYFHISRAHSVEVAAEIKGLRGSINS